MSTDSSTAAENPEDQNPEDQKPEPDTSRKKSISIVWVIPILGLLLGVWLVKRSFDEKGELIQITFTSAEGLEAGKTEVRCRNVNIGIVEEITLDPELHVKAEARIKPEHLDLVREGSRFWVVRPRVSGASITGLNTFISGSYIELDPGPGGAEKTVFTGNEAPPVTPSSVPGLRITLSAEKTGSVDVGSGVYFKGNLVGHIESRNFDPKTQKTQFGIFIQDKYSGLVNSETRFWRDSGLELKVGSDGFQLELPSLDALIAGGVSFGMPDNVYPGEPVQENYQTPLFADAATAESSAFKSSAEFILFLDQSIRGLTPGAPVEFRGLRIGRVKDISYQLVRGFEVKRIPVLIQLNERLLKENFPLSIHNDGPDTLSSALQKGLRASLKSSNLLTGQLFVDLDYYPGQPPARLGRAGEYAVLPTIQTGFASMEDRVAAILDKLNNIPIESLMAELEKTAGETTATLEKLQGSLNGTDDLVAEAQRTMKEATDTVKSLKKIMTGDDAQSLPGDVRATLAQINASLAPFAENGKINGQLLRTLDELRVTVRSIERTSDEIGDKPNSLLFGKDKKSSKIPRAR